MTTTPGMMHRLRVALLRHQTPLRLSTRGHTPAAYGLSRTRAHRRARAHTLRAPSIRDSFADGPFFKCRVLCHSCALIDTCTFPQDFAVCEKSRGGRRKSQKKKRKTKKNRKTKLPFFTTRSSRRLQSAAPRGRRGCSVCRVSRDEKDNEQRQNESAGSGRKKEKKKEEKRRKKRGMSESEGTNFWN